MYINSARVKNTFITFSRNLWTCFDDVVYSEVNISMATADSGFSYTGCGTSKVTPLSVYGVEKSVDQH